MTVRKRQYYKITRDNISECRFIAHFLLDHRTVEEIYRDQDEVNERLHEVLLAWEKETKETLRTWENLNGVLQMLQNPVSSGHVSGTQDAQPRYHLCYNASHNVVARVNFDTKVTEVRISKNHTCQATQELKRNKDYHEFISSPYRYFIFEDGVLSEDNHISFNWSNKEGINLQFVTQGKLLCHFV
ncbi:uncharacterized protein LOC130630589 [Hydractinia symbiolongicarpus]|uniref:uncharacterized protein LOC130630589 n=1 Tax=Hydractinia symbiolongicarpus TaxID=13093 RepID=UPI002551A758|nr:uncharacterized protein LOC130630589 [Hydractinia symbiolongicarpus]